MAFFLLSRTEGAQIRSVLRQLKITTIPIIITIEVANNVPFIGFLAESILETILFEIMLAFALASESFYFCKISRHRI